MLSPKQNLLGTSIELLESKSSLFNFSQKALYKRFLSDRFFLELLRTLSVRTK